VKDPPAYNFGEGHDAKCFYPLERWPLTGEEMKRRPEEAMEAAASG
jgi:hypothetical protein